jgi:hypothetical protein
MTRSSTRWVAATGALLLLVPTPTAQASARTVSLVSGGTANTPAAFAAAPAGSTSRTLFTTAEALLAADTDAAVDVYQRDGATLTLMTPGTTAALTFDAVSADGAAVVLDTTQSLAAGDTDTASDIYRVVGGVYTLLSGGSANTAAVFRATSADAGRVVFETTEAISGSDSGVTNDVYSSTGGAPVLLSGGGLLSLSTNFVAATPDLGTVAFTTNQALSGDTNLVADVYSVPGAGGTRTLVTNGTGNADSFAELTSNGAKIFWTTEDDGPGDSDGTRDVYVFSGGTSTLVSTGIQDVTYNGSSADGSITFYSSFEPLAGADADASSDVYRFTGTVATPTLMTGGSATIENANFRDSAADGSSVLFNTEQALPTTGDADTADDLYRSTGPSDADKTLLSGSGSTAVIWRTASDDAARVFFTSTDSLVGADTDTTQDVYVNEAGAVTLVSSGTANTVANLAGRSSDGSRAFFNTAEPLAGDTDTAVDVYESKVGTVTPPADTTPPTATLSGKAEQKNNGKVKVALTCGPSEACVVKATGNLKAGGKRYTLSGATATVATNGTTKLKLTVPKKAKDAATAALQADKKVKVAVTVVVSDAAGNERTLTFKLKLR